MIICLGPICVPIWPLLFLALKPLWSLLPEAQKRQLTSLWETTIYPYGIHPWFSRLPLKVQAFLTIGLKRKKTTTTTTTTTAYTPTSKDGAATGGAAAWGPVVLESGPVVLESGKVSYGTVEAITSDNAWTEALTKATPRSRLFVKFTADWCGPCKKIAPQYKALAQTNPRHRFVEVDIDELDDVAQKYGVMSIPHFSVFEAGKQLEGLKNSTQENLEAFVQKHAC